MTADVSILAVRVTAAAACAFGAVVLTMEFFRYLVVLPSTAVQAAVAELPLLAIGFWVLRRLRPVRPPDLVWSAAALIFGGTAAAGCALLANQGLGSLWAKTAGPAFASNWSAPLSAPLNEEILKLCGVVMVVLAAPQVIRGPLDGMIIGAITGLGFQAAENITYGLNAVALSGATDPVRAVWNSMLYRVATGGLGSHWTMTAVAGAGVGYLVHRGQAGLLPAAGCLLGAIAMHVLFDAPYLALPVKVAVNLVGAGTLYLTLRRGYAWRAREFLTGLAATGTVTAAEAADLASRRGRRQLAQRATPGPEREMLLTRQRELLALVDAMAA
jgi:RsiW-degrading membrane proteinase PrsW (M82 family)